MSTQTSAYSTQTDVKKQFHEQVSWQNTPHKQLTDIRYWLLAFGWVIYLVANYLFTVSTINGANAFLVYLESAYAVLDSEPLYNGVSGWIYLYPPLLAQLLVPIGHVVDHPMSAIVIWFGVNVAFMVATLSLLTPYVPRSKRKWLWVAPIVFIPFWQALYLGQVTIIMMALLALVWACVREDMPFIAGCILALAIWIKVFPVLLVVYFLWKRNWHILYGTVFAGVVLLLFQVLISGHELMFEFINVLFTLTSGGQPEATYENLSIFAFVSRLFQENIRVHPLFVNDLLFSIGRVSLIVIVFGVAVYTIYRSDANTNASTFRLSWRFDLEYGLVILTILLMGSTLWISGLPPLLFIYVLVLRNVRHFRHPNLVKLVCGVSFLLITLYQPMLIMFIDETVSAILLSMGFIGVMTAWSVLVVPLLRRKAYLDEILW